MSEYPLHRTRTRRKQWLLAGGGLTLVVLAAIITSALSDPPRPRGRNDETVRSYIGPGEKVAPEDAWRGVSDSRLSAIEGQLNALKIQQRQQAQRAGNAPADEEAELTRRLAGYGAPPSANGQTPPLSTAAAAAQPPAPTVSDAPAPPALMTVKLGVPQKPVAPMAAEPSPARNYLPAGVFGQARLLSGLDAPTGGQAQSNPHPVLLEFSDLAALPNRYRYDWKHCRILAAGYGDLSSERAYIRTETLSCVAQDGKVLDIPIKGFIVGEDGKAGMRGRLVSKQGQVLGNALLAGVASGIGSGLEKAATIQSVSPLGSTSTARAGDELQAGLGAGIGRSLDRLAHYYVTLAEKMFPVIEIDAGRTVDVVLSEGVHANAPPAK